MLKLKIIVGSSRPTRNADLVVPWVTERARAHGDFDVEVLDLREQDLPMFQEHGGTIGDWADPTYSVPAVKRWNTTIADGDCFVFVTPEYNHGIPGVLKNAIDSVFASGALRNKPAATVAYSGGIAAGARAVEQLALNLIEAEMVPLRNAVLIPFVHQAFEGEGTPKDRGADLAMTTMLEDLAWWGALLVEGRARALPPAGEREPAAG